MSRQNLASHDDHRRPWKVEENENEEEREKEDNSTHHQHVTVNEKYHNIDDDEGAEVAAAGVDMRVRILR